MPVSQTGRWRSSWWWISCCALLLTVILLLAPAWLLNRISNDRLSIVDASGTLWNGHGWLALRQTRRLATHVPNSLHVVLPVTWRLAWSDSPVIRIASLEGSGIVRFGFKGYSIELSEVGFALEHLPIPGPLDILGLSAQSRLESAKLDCGYRGPCRGQLRLSFDGLSLRMFPGEIIGDLQADVTLREASLESSIRIVKPVALRGAIELSGDGKGLPTIKGSLQGTERVSAQLKSAISTLGRSELDGVTIDMNPGS